MERSANDGIVAIKFYASWCRACKTIAPRFERLGKEFDGETPGGEPHVAVPSKRS